MLPEKIVHNNRWNVFCLVQKGFTREECYNMPVNEFNEYIRYLNQQTEEMLQAQKINTEIPNNEPHFAGNSLP